MRRLILTEAVCKSLLFSPLAVKDLIVKPFMEANTNFSNIVALFFSEIWIDLSCESQMNTMNLSSFIFFWRKNKHTKKNLQCRLCQFE